MALSNTVLEAFGNAKTVRNNNSSRFGNFSRVYFTSAGAMHTIQITTYLLETIRVSAVAPLERNFHIFYMMVTAMAAEPALWAEIDDAGAWGDYRLPTDPLQLEYLSQSRCLHADGWDDIEQYKELTSSCLDAIGLSGSGKRDLLRIIAAILHLGNITFIRVDVKTNPSQRETSEGAAVANHVSVDAAAALLGLDVSDLEKVRNR
jgi:myosin V